MSDIEGQVAVLGNQSVKWLKEKLIFADFSRLVEQNCDPRKLFDAIGAIGLAWSVESPQQKATSRFKQSPRPSASQGTPSDSQPEIEPSTSGPINLPPNSFKGEIGFDRSELKTVIKRLRQSADDVEHLHLIRIRDILREKYGFPAEVPGWFAPVEDDLALEKSGHKADTINLGHVLSELGELSSEGGVSRRLRVLARAAEEAGRHVYPPGQSLYTVNVATLTGYVHRRTGEWRDGEVSALIGATCDRTYDAEAHRKWRERHNQLIEDICWASSL